MEFCDLVPKGWHIVATGVNRFTSMATTYRPFRAFLLLAALVNQVGLDFLVGFQSKPNRPLILAFLLAE